MKKDNGDFENSNKCWICENDFMDTDVKVRDQVCKVLRIEIETSMVNKS